MILIFSGYIHIIIIFFKSLDSLVNNFVIKNASNDSLQRKSVHYFVKLLMMYLILYCFCVLLFLKILEAIRQVNLNCVLIYFFYLNTYCI